MVCLTGCGKENPQAAYKIENYHIDALGENTYVFSPLDDPKEVQAVLDRLWQVQEVNQFGEERYAVYFLPGEYDESISVKVGYYMQVAGLGYLPDDTKLPALNCDARWLGGPDNHNATCNFWRGVENLQINSNTMWAVSQATFMRRVHIGGSLYLHDEYGWASGGFLADSVVDGITDSGSQQQWLSRNCNWEKWLGENWNMVFAGIEPGKAPAGTWPAKAYTTVETVEEIQEKPFLVWDEEKGLGVFVPARRENSTGVSWQESGENLTKENLAGSFVPLTEFYVAKPQTDTAETLNAALREGKNLFFTPGIYGLSEELLVDREGCIILGTGLATLRPENGNACMKVTAEQDVILAGLLFDAGCKKSPLLLQVGVEGNTGSEDASVDVPTVLSDLFFRVGGALTEPVSVEACAEINNSHVLGDNFWVWRADHGSQVGWDINTAVNGLIVNGDNVTIYALMVEHFQEFQTLWRGNGGKVIMYQSEIPYDVPSQSEFVSHEGEVNGFASYKVDEDVESHEAWGIGIYAYNRDAIVEIHSAMEVPEKPDVKIHNVCAVMITGNPGITHVVNEEGGPCYRAGTRQIITEYLKK